VHTTPQKDKYVAIVCANPNPYGFLINSKIHEYIQKRQYLLDAQVEILADKYGFLTHSSYIDCSKIFSFKIKNLHSIQKIQNNTKVAIKVAVSKAITVEDIYKKLIV